MFFFQIFDNIHSAVYFVSFLTTPHLASRDLNKLYLAYDTHDDDDAHDDNDDDNDSDHYNDDDTGPTLASMCAMLITGWAGVPPSRHSPSTCCVSNAAVLELPNKTLRRFHNHR